MFCWRFFLGMVIITELMFVYILESDLIIVLHVIKRLMMAVVSGVILRERCIKNNCNHHFVTDVKAYLSRIKIVFFWLVQFFRGYAKV